MSYLSASERFTVATRDGLELAVARHGNPTGAEILLVHGLGQSQLSWSKQTCSSLADSCHIVIYDLRGHGDSSKPDSVAAYEDPALWASDMRAVIEAAGLKHPTIVGWSLGSLIAGHYIHRYGADHIKGVNVVGGVTRLAPELFGDAALAYTPLLASPDLATRSDAIVSFLTSCFATPPTDRDFLRMLAINAMVPRELMEAIGGLGDTGLDQAWASVRNLLASWGEDDQHTRPEMAGRLLDLNPAARVSVYEGVGHAPFYEQAERFNRELAAFALGLDGKAT